MIDAKLDHAIVASMARVMNALDARVDFASRYDFASNVKTMPAFRRLVARFKREHARHERVVQRIANLRASRAWS